MFVITTILNHYVDSLNLNYVSDRRQHVASTGAKNELTTFQLCQLNVPYTVSLVWLHKVFETVVVTHSFFSFNENFLLHAIPVGDRIPEEF